MATGSRADYTPLKPLVRRLSWEPRFDTALLVSGGHLVEDQGMTIEAIRDDGFEIDTQVENVLCGDSMFSMAKSFGLAALGFADALRRMQPDILVVLGDRYEALAVTVVAALARIPVAHIAGGQVTEGAIDDSLRHAITKLASLHFTSTGEFRRRLIQLGEQPERIHVVGALGLDNVLEIPLPDPDRIIRDHGIGLRRPVFLVTYHPATADPNGTEAGLVGLLAALEMLSDAAVVFTAANVDAAGVRINRRLRRFAEDHPDRTVFRKSLGQRSYLDLLASVDLVIGNSSSAIIEAPALHTPTVNIGSRQKGRPRPASVIDCAETAEDIFRAIDQALSPEHRLITRTVVSPYGDGHAAERVVRHLLSVDLHSLGIKRFIDLKM